MPLIRKQVERANAKKLGESKVEWDLDKSTGEFRSKRVATDKPQRGVKFTHRYQSGGHGVIKPEPGAV